jgi:hypothetical protein
MEFQMKKTIRKTYTFDDVLLMPQRSWILPHEVDLKTRISAYPNPFNPVVSFDITTPYSFDSELCLYNIKGQLVKKIYCDNLQKGNNKAVWDGRDENNRQVGSGIYLYHMQTPGGIVSGKISMVK